MLAAQGRDLREGVELRVPTTCPWSRCCERLGAQAVDKPTIIPIILIDADITIPTVTVVTTDTTAAGRLKGSTCAAVEI